MDRLDKFYTKQEIAKKCLSALDLDKYDVILEPSAGSGAFFFLLPEDKREGIDLEPDIEGEIQKADFLQYFPAWSGKKKYLVVGNPPFGKNSSLAKRFFHHASIFAQTIAFVLPRTFRKMSTENQLSKNFHKVFEELLPLESFELPDGTSYSVPCVFQVWEKKDYNRKTISLPSTHEDFYFLEKGRHYVVSDHVNVAITIDDEEHGFDFNLEDWKRLKKQKSLFPFLFSNFKAKRIEKDIEWKTQPDFVFRRAGAQAGKTTLDYESCALEGNLFIKTNDKKVLDVFNKMWDDWWSPRNYEERLDTKWDTAGTPSISKAELVQHYKLMKEKMNE